MIAVVCFIPKIVAILFIPRLNRLKGLEQFDKGEITALRCDRNFYKNINNDWYVIPSLQFNLDTKYFEITISWICWQYYICYSYNKEK